jgi:hypothetical protein
MGIGREIIKVLLLCNVFEVFKSFVDLEPVSVIKIRASSRHITQYTAYTTRNRSKIRICNSLTRTHSPYPRVSRVAVT